jgi:peptide-methionine (R)-S-oxide reductase
MNPARRATLGRLALALSAPLLSSRSLAAKDQRPAVEHAAWRPLLSAAAFEVLFEEATERPYSSPLNDEKRVGRYHCAACYSPLFSSAAKYDSGTGWPSFTEALPKAMGTKRDFKLLIPRTEYHCATCGGHQGHVFNDGPRPTGQRWCNNGLALRFVPEGEAAPALRWPASAG